MLIIIISIVVIAVLLIIFFGGGKSSVEPVPSEPEVIQKPDKEEINLEIPKEVTEIPANKEEPEVYSFDEKKEAERELTAEDLKQLAFSIAERYGSFSNQGKFGNISDLEVYMTSEMKAWSKRHVETESAKPYSGEYYGMNTTALIGEVVSFADNKAQILVTTRRKEIKNNQENVFDQKISINFSKVDSEWKVSGIYWQ